MSDLPKKLRERLGQLTFETYPEEMKANAVGLYSPDHEKFKSYQRGFVACYGELMEDPMLLWEALDFKLMGMSLDQIQEAVNHFEATTGIHPRRSNPVATSEPKPATDSVKDTEK